MGQPYAVALLNGVASHWVVISTLPEMTTHRLATMLTHVNMVAPPVQSPHVPQLRQGGWRR
jgi:hypothetical protein